MSQKLNISKQLHTQLIDNMEIEELDNSLNYEFIFSLPKKLKKLVIKALNK
jgi:hypothetical protein